MTSRATAPYAPSCNMPRDMRHVVVMSVEEEVSVGIEERDSVIVFNGPTLLETTVDSG